MRVLNFPTDKGVVFQTEDWKGLFDISKEIVTAFGDVITGGAVAVRIAGVLRVSNNILAGKVYHNGEVYDVAASTVTVANPVAVVVTTNGTAEPHNTHNGSVFDGGTFVVKSTRTLVFQDSGTALFAWLDLRDNLIERNRQGVAAVFTKGEIRSIYLATPTEVTAFLANFDGNGDGTNGGTFAGFGLCNGVGGKPNLKGRVLVGYSDVAGDYDAPGKTGGLEFVTLTAGQMPSHNHGGSTGNSGSHTHTLPVDVSNGASVESPFGYGDSSGSFVNQTIPSAGDHSHSIANDGGGQAHENRMPYFVVLKIIKL